MGLRLFVRTRLSPHTQQGGREQEEGQDRLLPSMVALLGRMVMAPSATSSCCSSGLTLEPHVSEPTHRKCPT